MIIKIGKWKAAVACLAAVGIIAAGSGAFGDAPAYKDISKVHCICSYSDESIVDRKQSVWLADFDGMKAAGFNTVWIVNVWKEFEPNVRKGNFSAKADANLRWLCQEAKKRDMKIMLGLGYIGSGWGPKGIDEAVWWIKPSDYGQYKDFLRHMASITKDFDNVLYMISDELLLSGTILYSPDKRKECIESFRAWAYTTNPDVKYWNNRWKTDYTWDTLTPVAPDKRKTQECWVDHRSWNSYLLRNNLPGLVEAVRAEKPDAIVGFHDFILQPEFPEADSPLPSPNPFNFTSIPHYYVYGTNKSSDIDENIKRLSTLMTYAKKRAPNMPLFIGELGADVKDCGEDGQKEFLEKALALLKQENAGYNIWNWRYYVEGEKKIYFSMLDEKGSPRPALKAVESFNRQVTF